MISEKYAKKFCCEDISLIENYAEAIADKENIWHCHHRLEIRVLPSGMVTLRSMQELIENGRYYGCPANELIFLTDSEHKKLHGLHQKKIYGKKHSEETKAKMSKAQKARKYDVEFGKKISEARLKRTYSEFHTKFKEHYNCTCTTGANQKNYQREIGFYKKYGYCSWEVENG